MFFVYFEPKTTYDKPSIYPQLCTITSLLHELINLAVDILKQ